MKRFAAVIRRTIIDCLYAKTPEAARELATKRYLSKDAIQRFRPEHDIEIVENEEISCPTHQEMYSYLLRYSSVHGWDKLFGIIRHYFSYHAFDRGEHEDHEPRPKNREQFELIDKLSQFSREEFDHGK